MADKLNPTISRIIPDYPAFISPFTFIYLSLKHLSTLRQADTDTARITTAASILGSITSIINSDDKLLDASGDLMEDIQSLKMPVPFLLAKIKIN